MNRTHRAFVCAALAATLVAPRPAAAATITIINQDGAGEGFNETTAAAPVGGNTGTTRGQQRLNVFNQAAAIWGSILPSTVTIQVQAQFNALTPCNATSGVLGSAGAIQIVRDFAGAELPATWYSSCARQQAGGHGPAPGHERHQRPVQHQRRQRHVPGADELVLRLRPQRGHQHRPACGRAARAGSRPRIQTFTSTSTGAFNGGFSDVYAHFLFDDTQGLGWEQMSNAQRQASAINPGNLVWTGPAVYGHAYQFLGAAPVRARGLHLRLQR